MIEGTRHERAALVITSYAIGFVTAFIGFGVAVTDTFTISTVPTQTASVVMATTPELEPVTTQATPLQETDEGLVFTTDKGTVLLSTYSGGEVAASDGQYVALATTSVSPDEQYAYFCEVPSITAENCAPYVYSVTTDIVYPVTIDGERVAFAAAEHTVEWSKSGPLSIANEIVDQLPE